MTSPDGVSARLIAKLDELERVVRFRFPLEKASVQPIDPKIENNAALTYPQISIPARIAIPTDVGPSGLEINDSFVPAMQSQGGGLSREEQPQTHGAPRSSDTFVRALTRFFGGKK